MTSFEGTVKYIWTQPNLCGDYMKTFLICPIAGYDQTPTEEIVANLEANGWDVHYPARDTNQDSDTGLECCEDNRKAIVNADVVHVVFDGKSRGCLFDMGMAFALQKPIIVIDMPEIESGKCFERAIRKYSLKSSIPFFERMMTGLDEKLDEIKEKMT